MEDISMLARVLLVVGRKKKGDEIGKLVEQLEYFGVEAEVCIDLLDFGSMWSQREFSMALIDLDDIPYGGYDPFGNLLDITSRVPSVFMSESGSLERWTRALESGAVSFVTRPLHPESLSRFIVRMITRTSKK
jgi:DNA-binding NtrC family response regulator